MRRRRNQRQNFFFHPPSSRMLLSIAAAAAVFFSLTLLLLPAPSSLSSLHLNNHHNLDGQEWFDHHSLNDSSDLTNDDFAPFLHMMFNNESSSQSSKEKKKKETWIVARFTPSNLDQLIRLQRIEHFFDGNSILDFWTSSLRGGGSVGRPVDVRMPRLFYDSPAFQRWMTMYSLNNNNNNLFNSHQITIPDVDQLIAHSKAQNEELKRNKKLKLLNINNNSSSLLYSDDDDDDFFSTYPSYHEMFSFLNRVGSSAEASSLGYQITSIGTSYEGNPLQMVSFGSRLSSAFSSNKKKLKKKKKKKKKKGKKTKGKNFKMKMRGRKGKRNKKKKGKPLIWMDCQFHAREWIAAPTCLYVIMMLVKGSKSKSSKRVKKYLKTFDFQFLPLANPDGFLYTQTDGHRLWRKTRSKRQKECFGVDPNRNFGYKWGTGGSSANPCSDTYRGPHPFSEPETAAVRDHLHREARERTLALYMTIHSYSQFIIIPWSYTKKLPANYGSMYRKGVAMARAIGRFKYGTEYFVGQSTRTLYVASGSSDDYNLGSVGARNAYTVEVRDTGKHGFELPASLILPSCSEFWAGFQVMLDGIIAEEEEGKK